MSDAELTDEEHDALHALIENEILETLDSGFPPAERMCRAALLLKLLHDEFMAMDDAEDVSDIVVAMTGLVMKRTISDHALFDTAGHA